MKTQRRDKNYFLSRSAFPQKFGWKAVACAKHRFQHHEAFLCNHSCQMANEELSHGRSAGLKTPLDLNLLLSLNVFGVHAAQHDIRCAVILVRAWLAVASEGTLCKGWPRGF